MASLCTKRFNVEVCHHWKVWNDRHDKRILRTYSFVSYTISCTKCNTKIKAAPILFSQKFLNMYDGYYIIKGKQCFKRNIFSVSHDIENDWLFCTHKIFIKIDCLMLFFNCYNIYFIFYLFSMFLFKNQ